MQRYFLPILFSIFFSCPILSSDNQNAKILQEEILSSVNKYSNIFTKEKIKYISDTVKAIIELKNDLDTISHEMKEIMKNKEKQQYLIELSDYFEKCFSSKDIDKHISLLKETSGNDDSIILQTQNAVITGYNLLEKTFNKNDFKIIYHDRRTYLRDFFENAFNQNEECLQGRIRHLETWDESFHNMNKIDVDVILKSRGFSSGDELVAYLISKVKNKIVFKYLNQMNNDYVTENYSEKKLMENPHFKNSFFNIDMVSNEIHDIIFKNGTMNTISINGKDYKESDLSVQKIKEILEIYGF